MKKRAPPPSAGGAAPPPKRAGKLARLYEKLESNNAAFLNAASSALLQQELTRTAAAPPPAQRPPPPPRVGGAAAGVGRVAVDAAELARRAERRARFLEEQAAAAEAANLRGASGTLVAARSSRGGAAVVGQSRALEKDYLRLTTLPTLAEVRPPAVLAAALERVKARWAEGVEYAWCCSQLKSIRQDLTVQNERGALAVAAYQAHGRVAIEVGDWAELKQVLAALRALHDEAAARGARGAAAAAVGAAEFEGYSLLLAAAAGREVLALELREVARRGALSRDPVLRLALAAACAASSGNRVALLRLYAAAPKMTPYLLDLLVERGRARAYACALSAYGGELPTAALGELWLGLGDDAAAAARWARGRGGALLPGGAALDVRASREGLARRRAAAAAAAGDGGAG